MKALFLTMQAFGPYTSKVHIDFSKLENKLFLITGPTGSGKTTILDGISFALFCKSTGARRSFINMRNVAADEKTSTDVCFDFEQNGDKYRFHRSLSFGKSRKSGEIKIKETHECLKFNFDNNSWELISSGSESKIRLKAQDLLGLNSDQFSQVIVLPQGEFRKLLLSNSNDKLKILQTLFKTECFEKITEAARVLAKDIKKQCEFNLSNYELVLRQQNVKSIDELKANLVKKRQDCEILTSDVEQLKNLLLQKKSIFDEEQKLTDLFKKLQQLYNRLEELDSRQLQIDELKQKSNYLSYVKIIYPYFKNYLDMNEKLDKDFTEYSTSYKNVEIAYNALLEAQKSAQKKDALKDEVISCLSQIDRFDNSLNNLEKINEQEKNIQSINSELKKAETLKIQKGDMLLKLQQKYEKLDLDLNYIKELSLNLSEYKTAFNELSNKQKAYIKQNELISQVEKLESDMHSFKLKLENAMQILNNNKIKLDSIKTKEKNNIAAILASDLKLNMPCPVCGATHHPNLAVGKNDIQYNDIIASLEAEILDSEAELLKINTSLAEIKANFYLKSELLESQKKFCSEFSLSEVDVNTSLNKIKNLIFETANKLDINLEEDEFTEAEFSIISRALKDNEDIKVNQLSDVDRKIIDLRKSIEEITERINDYTVDIKVKQSSVDALKEQLPDSLCEYDSKVLKNDLNKKHHELSDKVSSIKQRIKFIEEQLASTGKNFNICFERMKLALKNYTKSMQETNAVFITLKDKLQEQNISIGSTDLKMFEYQNLDNEIYSIKDKISKYSTEKAIVSKEYQDLKDNLKDKIKPDLPKLESEINSINEELILKLEDLGLLKSELKGCQDSLKMIQDIQDISQQLSKEFSESSKIADLLMGKNSCKMPFKMFALSLMLEDILNCSNNYFSDLSQDRYSFKRKNNNVVSRGFSGLDIEVFDAHFGACRAVETLSGGEMFLASLALSFGLSDVVQNYSGGVRIDSIFIDEGFGSLDEETLNVALNALLMIKEHGRTVGIISHVNELKSFIPYKIQISKLSDGQSNLHLVKG